MEDEKYVKLKKWALYLIIAVCSVFLVGVLFYTIPKIIYLILPFIIGYIISFLMRPLVKLFHKVLHFPNKLAAAIALILTVSVLGIILYLLISVIIDQIVTIYQQWPVIYKGISDSYSHLFAVVSRYYDGLSPETQDFLSSALQNAAKQITSLIQPVTKFAGDTAKSLPGTLIFTIVMIMSAYFMSANKRMMPNLIKKIVPDSIYHRIKVTKDQILHALSGYIRAELIIMGTVFLILSVTLTIIRIKYSFLVALGIAMIDALPVFGSGTILIPWSLISLASGDLRMAISLIVIYVIVLLTRQLIEPKIVSSQIGLHPLATLLAMYVGLKLFGVLGLILGPITILLTVNFIRAFRAQSLTQNPPVFSADKESEATK